ncbi:MAG: hypothetical protein KDG55_08845 [Rhodocyclaceae bacterium]|nr:hypothetical protein [Rhodocyclaceae bacterium]
MLISKRDIQEAWRAAQAAFTWPLFFTMAGIALVVGGLAYVGGHSDPRYRTLCTDPSDAAFLFFFISIPVIGVCGLVGLGEGVQWGKLRHKQPAFARGHMVRASILLGIALVLIVADATGLMKLCRML